jgi:PAS domain-containing protein
MMQDPEEGSSESSGSTSQQHPNGLHTNTHIVASTTATEFSWVDHVSFPMFVVDVCSLEFPIVAWNPAISELTNIHADEALCRPAVSVLVLSGDKCSWIQSVLSELIRKVDDATDAAASREVHVKLQNIRMAETNKSNSGAATTTFQLNVTLQRHTKTKDIIGLVCLLEKQQEDSAAWTLAHDAEGSLEHTSARWNAASATSKGNANAINYRREESFAITAAPPAEEYQLLLETCNAPVFGVDMDGLVNEWNQCMVEITGISKHHTIGMPLVSDALTLPFMQQPLRDALENAFRGRSTSNFELEIVTHNPQLRSISRRATMQMMSSLDDSDHDGDQYVEEECSRFLIVNVTPRRNLQNRIVGAVAIAQDVTEACNHDRAVAAMANELRQLIDTANAPIFGIDRDG